MEKLMLLRKQKNITQQEAAAIFGISRQAYSNYELGNRDPDYAMLKKMANYFGVSIDYLLDEGDSEFNHIPGIIPLHKVTYIPLLGKIACGKPIFAEENIDRKILLPDEIKADFALRCIGDSMVDANIENGDIVFLRHQPIVENGEVAAVLIDAEAEMQATLKKVYITADSITLVPCNDNYAPMTFIKKDMNKVTIIGKVVGILKKV